MVLTLVFDKDASSLACLLFGVDNVGKLLSMNFGKVYI
jgi:hypothetical protein